MEQTVDAGLERSSLQSYLERIGYWAGPELRRRNAYVLSPSAYAVSPRQRRDLERLSLYTYAAVKTLSVDLTRLANQQSISNGDARFLALATGNTRGLVHPKHADNAVPPVIKVDLVQSGDGRYFIAEVDAYNPRGFGYLALLDGSLPEEHRSAGPGTGIAGLADLMRKAERRGLKEWLLIVSEFERYYEPSFRILASFLKERNVDLKVVPERGGQNFRSGAMNVFCVPESMHQNASDRNYLTEQWRSGLVNLFYPPTAYLGSKAFLPYIRSRPGMEEFVPECSLVDRKNDPLVTADGTPVVLKGVMSSGLKKVVFRDLEPERFAGEYANARKTKNPQWLLQAQVPQEPTSIVVFDDDGNRITGEYFLRITAYVTENGLLGAEVTGRTDRAVHGAPDCIQIPTLHG